MDREEEFLEGKYRVGEALGHGGAGVVYEGLDIRTGRKVAIKVMHLSPATDRKALARFHREARAAVQARSPHVVDVFATGELRNGDPYIIMELLEGEDLRVRIERTGRMSPLEIAHIAVQTLEGLARVHGAGILHRDLKPANLFLARAADGSERVKILDFGVCKIWGEPGEGTGLGGLLGTLPYMAPELIEHGPKKLDARADLYALGVILYRAVSGALPYKAKNFVELRIQMREGRPPLLSEVSPGVDGGFARLVDKAMEWEASGRFASASAFQAALVGWMGTVSRVDSLLGEFLSDVPPRTPVC